MKLIGWSLIIISVISLMIIIVVDVVAERDYNSRFGSYWELADRSSTLQAKEQYITQFVSNIQTNRDDFADYNAIIIKTPQNNFDNNLGAVITLRDRLQEVQKMNVSSFEYQLAIQQITGQEQGEADAMMNDIEGAFYLRNYPLLWNWICGILIFLILITLTIGITMLMLSK